MFLDSRSIDQGTVFTTDLCIVGAGIAGLTLAMEFKQANFKTCVIESGGEQSDKATQSLYWGENIGIPYYPLDTSRARFLGGTSHYWVIRLPQNGMGVRLRPMDPIDFEHREWVPHSGWPFRKTHLDPFYERAQKVCQIGPFSYAPKDWIQPGIRDELKFLGDRIQTTVFQFGYRDTFRKEYADEAKKSESISIFLNGNAVEIETNETATEVTGIRVACLNGNRFSISARMFILAMGGLETPRLLLLSNKVQKAGLGNGKDLVGRFFMEHPHLWSGAFFPSSPAISNSTGLYEIFSKDGGCPVMGKLAMGEDTLRKEKLLNWVTSIHPNYELSHRHYLGYDKPGVSALRSLKKSLKKPYMSKNIWTQTSKVLSGAPDVCRYLYRKYGEHIKRGFSRSEHQTVFNLNPMMEQAPNPDSRVTLGTEKDALGQFRIRLDWQLTALDTYTMTRAQEILGEELKKAGLGHLVIETDKNTLPKGIHGGWHHMGTTRMHPDPNWGVVDSNCRVHGISNLFIGGASVFPTSGYANPVLTTVALVLRLADHIRDTMEH